MSQEQENNESTIEHFKLRAFRAIENRTDCEKFHNGHTKVLTDVGITNLKTTDPEWFNDPKVIVVTATDLEGEVIGGLRIHVYDGTSSVPLIEALYDLDPKITEVLNKSLPDPTAEVCGLWNSRKIFGKGISPLLCICSVVVVKRLGLRDFYCFSAPYTEKMIKMNGCVRVTEIGNEGTFHYPTPEFISCVLHNPDVETCEFAEDYNKSRIFSLSNSPKQTIIERGPRGNLSIEYDLDF